MLLTFPEVSQYITHPISLIAYVCALIVLVIINRDRQGTINITADVPRHERSQLKALELRHRLKLTIILCLSIIIGGLMITYFLLRYEEKSSINKSFYKVRMLFGYVKSARPLPDHLKITITELALEKELQADGEFAFNITTILNPSDTARHFTARIFGRQTGSSPIYPDTLITLDSDVKNVIQLSPLPPPRESSNKTQTGEKESASGIVCDNNNQPIPGAIITIEGANQIKSGPDGRFAFSSKNITHPNLRIEGKWQGLTGEVYVGRNQKDIKLKLK